MMAVVPPEERSAASGVTGVARTIGASISPVCAGLLFARPALINVPFFMAGALKIAYDLALYRSFSPFSRRRNCDRIASVTDGLTDVPSTFASRDASNTRPAILITSRVRHSDNPTVTPLCC